MNALVDIWSDTLLLFGRGNGALYVQGAILLYRYRFEVYCRLQVVLQCGSVGVLQYNLVVPTVPGTCQ